MIFLVKWIDTEKKHHTKEYKSEKDARRAKAWLINNGAEKANISVVFNEKTIDFSET